ncbi:uncharacterized protein APUU_61000S [Aspergillus puulaauensis]|uniref:Uncharacterized protein n=1 Tax=Aspergillus puulaauensis TaxID=1220207 RepID=A0A7R7XUG8_9EURO|nr:uncharacterized protein APUU_61000S [Aspergillus puulaauensis]BCS27952.1 hypothetical protein APUU_61000S [Aspergillus puulaauensis]
MLWNPAKSTLKIFLGRSLGSIVTPAHLMLDTFTESILNVLSDQGLLVLALVTSHFDPTSDIHQHFNQQRHTPDQVLSEAPQLLSLESYHLVRSLEVPDELNAMCRYSFPTIEGLKAHKDQFELAKADLELHLDSFDTMLEMILNTDTSGRLHHMEQRRGMEKCLQIRKKLCDRVDALGAKQKEDDFQDLPTDPNTGTKISVLNTYSTGDAYY